MTDRLLSSAPMRWVGDLSYSLYLWHWPLIAFYRLLTGVELSPVETVGLVAASFLLAWASYTGIEQPFLRVLRRDSAAAPRAGKVALGGFVALLATAGLCLGAARLTERFRTYSPEVQSLLAFAASHYNGPDHVYQFRRLVCFHDTEENKGFRVSEPDCLKRSETKPNILLMGDSHAVQYWRALAERFPDHHVIQATAMRCRPVMNGGGDRACAARMERIFAQLARRGRVEAVILSALWEDGDVEGLIRTVQALQGEGLRVTVLGPGVRYQGDLPYIMARTRLFSGRDGAPDSYIVRDRQTLDARMGPLIRATGAGYVSVHQLQCPQGRCTLRTRDGQPFLFDSNHVTLTASRELVARMPRSLICRDEKGCEP